MVRRWPLEVYLHTPVSTSLGGTDSIPTYPPSRLVPTYPLLMATRTDTLEGALSKTRTVVLAGGRGVVRSY